MTNVYQWYVDFVGSSGLVTAYTLDMAKIKVLNKFKFDEFALDNFQIKYLYSLQHVHEIVSKLNNDEVVVIDEFGLKRGDVNYG